MDTTAPVTVRIEPRSAWAVFDMKELWRYRDVLILLALRDIKLRYRQTALGVIWVILQPVLAAAIFAIIFGHFARLPSSGVAYLPFVFAGLVSWGLLSNILQRCGNSLVAESRLITKVYFPRILVPCASAVSALVDFGVSLAVLALIVALSGLSPGWQVLALPLAICGVLLLSIGVGLWVSALNVRFRDFTYALPFAVQVWFFATPVAYGLELIPHTWQPLAALNPMVGFVELFRAASLGTPLPAVGILACAAATTLVLFFSGGVYFQRVERRFADHL